MQAKKPGPAARYAAALRREAEAFVFPYTPLTVFFLLVELFINIYLIIKYTNPNFYFVGADSFILQNGAMIFFSLSGWLMHKALIGLRKGKINGLKILMLVSIGLAAVVFAQIFVIKFLLISISPFDLYMFFTSTAIAEEFLFRFGLQPAVEKSIRTAFRRGSAVIRWAPVISVLVVSSAFALYHQFVGYDIRMILAVFLSGLILGIIFRVGKSIDSTIIIHILVNLIAVSQTV